MGLLSKLRAVHRREPYAHEDENTDRPWLANLKHGKFRPLSEVKVETPVALPGLSPTEFLLPQIEKHITLDEFPFIAERRYKNTDYSEAQLCERIAALKWWTYYFSFIKHVDTRPHGTFTDETIIFHRYRSQLISETVVDLLGENAASARVLDLACNCGAFTMDVATRGAGHVHGVEYRAENLAQAEFLAEYYRIHNVSFAQGDVYNLKDEKYDAILCLGLLYHVTQPIELLEYCYRNASQFVVVETVCHKHPFSAWMVVGNKDVSISTEGTRAVEFQPTYRGLIDSMRAVGFRDIVEVVGRCDSRVSLFSDSLRRCLIGFK